MSQQENFAVIDPNSLSDHDKLFFETISAILADKHYNSLIQTINEITELVSVAFATIRTADAQTCRNYCAHLYRLALDPKCVLREPETVPEDVVIFSEAYSEIEEIEHVAINILGLNWEKCAIVLYGGEDALRHYEKLKLQYSVRKRLAMNSCYGKLVLATQELRDTASSLRRMAKSAHFSAKEMEGIYQSSMVQLGKLEQKRKVPKSKVTDKQLEDIQATALDAERKWGYALSRELEFNDSRDHLLDMYDMLYKFIGLIE